MQKRNFFLFTLQTFRNLLVSYSLLFLAPLAVSFMIYIASVSMIAKETEQANKASLMLLRQVVDAKLKELFITADQLSINEKVQSVAIANPPVSPFQRMSMKEVQNLLQQAKLVNSFIEGIYLYLPKTGYVLSDVSRYKGDEFELTAGTSFGMPMSEWEAMLRSGRYRRILALRPSSPAVNPSFVFTQKFILEGIDRVPAVLAIKIDGRNLSELLDTVRWNSRAKLVISAPDGIFRSDPDGSSPPAWLAYGSLSKQYGMREKRLGGERHIMAGIGSDAADLRYVSLIPADIYKRSIVFIRRVMLGYVIFCLTGGFLLSYFMAMKNYTPIRRLTKIFLDRLGGDETSAGKDFPFLEEALKRLLQENADLEETIRSQNETVRGSLLARLVRSHPSQTASLLESCAACGIAFPTENFLLIAVLVDERGATIEGQSPPGESDAVALVGYMLRSVLEELAGERHRAYATDVEGVTMCLVDLSVTKDSDPGWEETMDEMVTIAVKVRALFRDKFDIGLSFAVSAVYETLSALPLAAAEVDRIVESIGLFEKKNVTILADSVDMTGPVTSPGGSLALHRLIAERAYAEDFPAVATEVRRYLASGPGENGMSLQVAKLRMSGVMNMVSEILFELRPSLNPGFMEELNPVDRLSRVKSIPELQRQVDEIFIRLESHFRERKTDPAVNLKDAVARYVEENFRDRNLSVNSIADRFGVSLPHLSRTFKRDAGVGLLDYIHILRVREAEALIREGRLSIEEIAGKVGCGSRITLARAFKRYEGVAPAAFRDLG